MRADAETSPPAQQRRRKLFSEGSMTLYEFAMCWLIFGQLHILAMIEMAKYAERDR